MVARTTETKSCTANPFVKARKRPWILTLILCRLSLVLEASFGVHTTEYIDTWKEYDYIVVGGGASGCVVARMLSDAGFETLLMERGDDPYRTVSTRDAFGGRDALANPKIAQPIITRSGVRLHTANVLGGGTAINTGVWVEENGDYFSAILEYLAAVSQQPEQLQQWRDLFYGSEQAFAWLRRFFVRNTRVQVGEGGASPHETGKPLSDDRHGDRAGVSQSIYARYARTVERIASQWLAPYDGYSSEIRPGQSWSAFTSFREHDKPLEAVNSEPARKHSKRRSTAADLVFTANNRLTILLNNTVDTIAPRSLSPLEKFSIVNPLQIACVNYHRTLETEPGMEGSIQQKEEGILSLVGDPASDSVGDPTSDSASDENSGGAFSAREKLISRQQGVLGRVEAINRKREELERKAQLVQSAQHVNWLETTKKFSVTDQSINTGFKYPRRVCLKGTRQVTRADPLGTNWRNDNQFIRGEVILSAGAIHTPHILFKSGIGSKKNTDRLGVRNLVDNEWVGRNLQDRPAIGISLQVKAPADMDLRLSEPMIGHLAAIAVQNRAAVLPGEWAGPAEAPAADPASNFETRTIGFLDVFGGDFAEGYVSASRLLFPPELRNTPLADRVVNWLTSCQDERRRAIYAENDARTPPLRDADFYPAGAVVEAEAPSFLSAALSANENAAAGRLYAEANSRVFGKPPPSGLDPRTSRLLTCAMANASDPCFANNAVWLTFLTHIRSRGSVGVDWRGALDVDPGYLRDPEDLSDLVENLRVLLNMISVDGNAARLSDIFVLASDSQCPAHDFRSERDIYASLRTLSRAYVDRLASKQAPPAGQTPFGQPQLVQSPILQNPPARSPLATVPQNLPAANDTAALQGFVRNHMTSMWHATGSVPLGVVLDDECHLAAVQRLAVIDASALPIQTRMNPVATIMAFAVLAIKHKLRYTHADPRV